MKKSINRYLSNTTSYVIYVLGKILFDLVMINAYLILITSLSSS